MTTEELKIGNEWLGILNAHSSDYATKLLFTQTANFLKSRHSGKKVSKFMRETKTNTLLSKQVNTNVPKPMSLLEAAKLRQQETIEDDFDGVENVLAIDETGETEEKMPKKRGRK